MCVCVFMGGLSLFMGIRLGLHTTIEKITTTNDLHFLKNDDDDE